MAKNKDHSMRKTLEILGFALGFCLLFSIFVYRDVITSSRMFNFFVVFGVIAALIFILIYILNNVKISPKSTSRKKRRK
ncbi:MAG: hypothetical protein M1524_04435 [Patescibacteria group bacterium]|nr:hypothetical protein [Patescibacteria group bacterium]